MPAHPELIAALRETADKKAAVLWETAGSRAEQCRVDAERETECERDQAEQEMTAYARGLEDAISAEAETKARRIRMSATETLASRAWRLACADLPQLREHDYEAVFSGLAGEIPDRPWRRVRVNPADRELAHRHFTEAQVLVDEAIDGGMAVETDDGRVRVDNTLRTRLKRAWPDILPALLSDILKEIPDDQPPA